MSSEFLPGALTLSKAPQWLGMSREKLRQLRLGNLEGVPPFPKPIWNGVREVFLVEDLMAWLKECPKRPGLAP